MFNKININKSREAFLKNFAVLKKTVNKNITPFEVDQSKKIIIRKQTEASANESGKLTDSDSFNICIISTPPYGLDTPWKSGINSPAANLNGTPAPYFKKTSLSDGTDGTINISCISGKVNNIFYSCDEHFFTSFKSQNCGHIGHIIKVPEDISFTENSSATVRARFRLPRNVSENPVFELKNRDTGVVAVTGWAWIQVVALDPSHENLLFDTYKVFLSKTRINHTEDGSYEHDFVIDLNIPRLPRNTDGFMFTVGINIDTYVQREFSPGENGLPLTEYALIDFRSGHIDEPQILPPAPGERMGKKGPGGIKISSFKLCLNNVKETPFF